MLGNELLQQDTISYGDWQEQAGLIEESPILWGKAVGDTVGKLKPSV